MEVLLMSEKKYIAGLYLRLSKDDERTGESVSIENQRLLLTNYAQEKGWDIKEVYIDDGWSGTNMQRPAFQRMMRDAEDRRINLIAVKDLSRIGRNYIEVGRLTEETLPRLGCRFVALNDSVDSMLGDNDMMVYRNLFNEFYSKDTSKKVRAVKQACMKQGKYMGTYAPLGYMKDPANKHRLIVDEDTAPIVRRIFRLRCQGMGQRAISNLLNDERVPPPRALYYQKKGRDNPTVCNHLWSKDAVKSILSNECYIGNLVQGKKGTVSYKNRTVVNKTEDQWVRVENTHEPLVSLEDWATVRSLDNRNYRPRKDSDGKVHLFSSLVKCADCGFHMRAHIHHQTLKDGTKTSYTGYICGNYARSGKIACSLHMVQEYVLAQLVLDEIRSHAALVSFDRQRVVKAIMNGKDRESISLQELHQQQLRISESRLAELDKIIRMLYEDRVNGVITDAMFKEMMESYEDERVGLDGSVCELRAKLDRCDRDVCDVSAWIKAISKYSELQELSREILFELVDRIEVFEPEKIGKQRVCRIRIHYRFVGVISETLAGSEDSFAVVEGGGLLEQAV
jgi:DNA invertase Pin-like site-specific DNA recombinase